MLLLSEVIGPLSAFLGASLFLLGLGSIMVNLAFNYNKIRTRAIRILADKEAAAFESQLNHLDARLCGDSDDRDQRALRNVREIYKAFAKDLRDGKITRVPSAMLADIDKIYFEIIHQLTRQYEMYETTRKVTGDLCSKLQVQRERMIKEIESSVINLSDAISEIRAIAFQAGDGQLAKLQEKLNFQLQVAKDAEIKIAEAINSGDERVRFKEYLQE